MNFRPPWLLSSRHFLRRYRVAVVFFLLIFIGGGAALFLYYRSLPEEERVAVIRSNPVIQNMLPLLRSARKVSDIFYLPYYFRKNNLEHYQLFIDTAVLQEMNDSLPPPFADAVLTDEFKKWRDASLVTPTGEIFEVEIRYRGDNSIHWDSRKKSIAVRFKDDEAYRGMKRINFIIPHDRNFVLEHVHLYQSRKLGVPAPQSDFGNLTINGRPQGLYFVIEGWDSAFLAKNNFSEETNFYGMGEAHEWLGRLDVVFEDLWLWESEVKDIFTRYEDFSYAAKFLEALNEWDDDYFHDHIFDIVDEENFFNWLIAQNLASSTHENGINLRPIFDNVTGKFKFVTWDIGIYEPAFDPYRSASPLVNRVLSYPDYLHKRNVLLWQYINDPEGFSDDLEFFDESVFRISAALYQDRNKIYTNRWADKKISETRKLFTDNVEFWRDQLAFNRALVNVTLSPPAKQNSLSGKLLVFVEVIVDNPSDVVLAGIKTNKVGLADHHGMFQVYYDTDGDELLSAADELVATFDAEKMDFSKAESVNLYAKRLPLAENLPLIITKTKHNFFITAENISPDLSWEKMKFEFRNAVGGQALKGKEVGQRFLNGQIFSLFDLIGSSWDEVKRRFSFLAPTIVSGQTIIFPPNTYLITETFIIPRDYQVRISPGARFVFSPGSSIFSYSPVVAEGLSGNQITFTAANTVQGWGTLVVLGTSSEENIFSHTIFEYGGESFVNGVPATGMLSLFESDGAVADSVFRFAKGDDGLNVKRGTVHISRNLFYQNSFDGLDVDWSDSIVEENMFIENGNDGVDLSGFGPTIRSNYIVASLDKGISVGEHSHAVIYNNIIRGAILGIAPKDLSDPLIFNNNIIDTQDAISAYQKKEIFGGSQPILFNNLFYGNDRVFDHDSQSIISSNFDLYEGVDNYQDPGCDIFGFCQALHLRQYGKVTDSIKPYLADQDVLNESFPVGVFNEEPLQTLVNRYQNLIPR